MDIDRLYELYFKDIYTYIHSLSHNKAVAEEVAQEVFFKALKNIDTFDGKKNVRAWLFTIAKNTYFTYYKHEKALTTCSIDKTVVGSNDDIIEYLVVEEQSFAVHKFLHEMKEPYKEVFMLRFFGELSYEKIGMLFNKNAGWARVCCYRAKNKLLKCLEGIEDE